MKTMFPLDNTRSAACCRAEAVLALYKSAGCREEWQEMLTMAIADLAMLSDAEYGVSCAEARSEGDPCGGTGMSAESACEEGAALAREVMDEEQRQAARDDGGLYDDVLR